MVLKRADPFCDRALAMTETRRFVACRSSFLPSEVGPLLAQRLLFLHESVTVRLILIQIAILEGRHRLVDEFAEFRLCVENLAVAALGMTGVDRG